MVNWLGVSSRGDAGSTGRQREIGRDRKSKRKIVEEHAINRPAPRLNGATKASVLPRLNNISTNKTGWEATCCIKHVKCCFGNFSKAPLEHSFKCVTPRHNLDDIKLPLVKVTKPVYLLL